MEILFDEVAGALVQQAKFAEGEIIEIASTLDEMSSENRTCRRHCNFHGLGLPFLTAPAQYTMLTLDNPHREVFEIQFFAACNSRQQRFVNACAQGDIYRRSRADDFGAKALGDKRDVTDMVGVAVAREDVIGAADNIQDGIFVGFPFFFRERLPAREERIDQNLGLSKLDLPACGTEPSQGHRLRLRSRRAGFRFRGFTSSSNRDHYEKDH